MKVPFANLGLSCLGCAVSKLQNRNMHCELCLSTPYWTRGNHVSDLGLSSRILKAIERHQQSCVRQRYGTLHGLCVFQRPRTSIRLYNAFLIRALQH